MTWKSFKTTCATCGDVVVSVERQAEKADTLSLDGHCPSCGRFIGRKMWRGDKPMMMECQLCTEEEAA